MSNEPQTPQEPQTYQEKGEQDSIWLIIAEWIESLTGGGK